MGVIQGIHTPQFALSPLPEVDFEAIIFRSFLLLTEFFYWSQKKCKTIEQRYFVKL
jgi:hypothetical protein